MAKVSKANVDYSLGMEKSHCGKVFSDDKGYCTHYHGNETSGDCDKVEGTVKAVYWCKLFKKAVR